MISNTTTLAATCQAVDGTVNLTSVTGVTGPGPNKTTRTVIWIDREAMEVSASPSGNIVPVVRGVNGTLREYHAIGAFVWVGAEVDFTSFTGWTDPGLGQYGSMGRALETTTVTGPTDTATLTESQLLGGYIIGIPTGAANYTLPTAALLLQALLAFTENGWIGMSFYFNITNHSAGANTITLVAGTGVTLNPASQTVAQNATSRYKVVFTNIITPAYTVYPA
jgi:hypothetical protein